jgi:hypothetical protein
VQRGGHPEAQPSLDVVWGQVGSVMDHRGVGPSEACGGPSLTATASTAGAPVGDGDCARITQG